MHSAGTSFEPSYCFNSCGCFVGVHVGVFPQSCFNWFKQQQQPYHRACGILHTFLFCWYAPIMWNMSVPFLMGLLSVVVQFVAQTSILTCKLNFYQPRARTDTQPHAFSLSMVAYWLPVIGVEIRTSETPKYSHCTWVKSLPIRWSETHLLFGGFCTRWTVVFPQ